MDCVEYYNSDNYFKTKINFSEISKKTLFQNLKRYNSYHNMNYFIFDVNEEDNLNLIFSKIESCFIKDIYIKSFKDSVKKYIILFKNEEKYHIHFYYGEKLNVIIYKDNVKNYLKKQKFFPDRICAIYNEV